MFRYPKMPSAAGARLGPCVTFEKLDGTNLFWEWTAADGWVSFGTRSAGYPFTDEGRAAFVARHGMSDAAPLFDRDLAAPLAELLRQHVASGHAVAFTEYLGAKSFAGTHQPDDPKRLVLFDVWADGHGFLGPVRFLEAFGALPVPRVVFRGKFSGKLTEDVRIGKYGVAEGAVIKGGDGDDVWMAKVKTQAYLERLKATFADGWEAYWE